ncbi:MAG: BamA/TamA family outer membrane protein [Fervidobacterium sp.]|nr:BamA/TamA family outer membrane protein [Fervidobacterium sp.]
MIKKGIFVLTLVLLLTVFSFSFILESVQFEGLKMLTSSELEECYKMYVGRDVNENAVYEILSNLDDTGYFDEIDYQIVEGKEPGKKILKIKVIENEPVKKVNLEVVGPGVLDKESIQKELKLKEGKPFSFAKFWESIDSIAKLYSSKGYLVATPKSQDKSFAFVYVGGKVEESEISFLVTEYVLYDLEFDVVSEDEDLKKEFAKIKSEIGVKKYRDYESKNWFEKIFDSEKDYVPTLQTIQGIFQSISKYVYFRVVDMSVQQTGSKIPAKSISITLTDNTVVRQPLKLKGIKTVGNTVFMQKELIGETKEDTYTNYAILSKIQQIKDKYDRAGYFIDLNLSLDDEGYLNIKITEIKVRNVKLSGNNVTRDYVFNDVISVKPGDYLKKGELQNTYIELSKLNFFKNVDIGIEPVEGDSSKVDVVIKISEKDKKFDFQGGVTWGPVKDRPWWEGIAGLLSLSTTNPFGYGENISISLQKALSTTNLSLTAGIRKPFGLPVLFNNTFSYQDNPKDGGTESKLSYSVELNTLKTPLGQFGIGVGYKDTTYATDTTLNTKTVSISGNYVYETLDNLYVPMKGFSFTLTGTKYIPLSEKGSDALSYLGELTFHIPLDQSISLAFRLLSGQVFQTAGEPVTYELTGLNQVRGVKSSDKGTVIGLSNNEIRFKAPDQMFYISVFYDLGFVDNIFSFNKLVSSAGIEFGLTVPIFGLIRAGWGIPIPSTQLNFYFMFGKTF